MTTEERSGFEGWAILELMGHRRLAGFLSEQTVAGAALLRIDIPAVTADDAIETADAAATQFYAPAAVYAITPVNEATARRVAAAFRPGPVTEWDLPTKRVTAPASPHVEAGHYIEREDDDDEERWA